MQTGEQHADGPIRAGDAASEDDPEREREPAEHRRSPGPLVLALIGVGCAIFGLLPWIVTGMRLPTQNVWAEPVPAEGMPIALLPFSQYAVTLIIAVLVTGSLAAGVVARVLRHRSGFRLWPVVLGVAVVQVIALVQTTLTVEDGIMQRREAVLYVVGLAAGTTFTIGVGLVVMILVTRAPVAVATVAIAVIAYPATRWITALVVPFGSEATANAFQFAMSASFPWVPAVLFGVLLAWCGLRPIARVVAWVIALGLLWVMPALFTAMGSALGTRVLATRPAEMLDYGIGVFVAAMGGLAAQGQLLVVAIVIGLVGTGLREVLARSRRRRSAV
jgi:hypothetical protein